MMLSSKRAALILFVGDIALFSISLWLSLGLRTFSMPTSHLFLQHLTAFSSLFLVWVIVFFIAGLYESRSVVLASRSLSSTLLWAQNINILLAALFFFFVPIYGIAPKTILVIYLIISYLVILGWRVLIFPRLGVHRIDKGIAIGNSIETHELVYILREAKRSPVRITGVVDPESSQANLEVKTLISRDSPKYIVADFSVPLVQTILPSIEPLLAKGVMFYNTMSLYEELFGRVPVSTINIPWLAANASKYSHPMYDFFKRTTDIIIGVIGGVFSLVIYPFIIVAIKCDDGGSVFIAQTRVGQDNKHIKIYKFRSMQRNVISLSASLQENKITRVGYFLRATRLDEVPQLWSVVRGDLSLIGPRPELPAGVDHYTSVIPMYNVRHLIKPGLSGWAQLYQENHPHHGAFVEETREKLSYDLYYLKHRSFMLDLVIGLKTIKKILTRSGA